MEQIEIARHSKRLVEQLREENEGLRNIIEERISPFEAVRKDAERYRKLRHWMSSGVQDGWDEVMKLAAVAQYLSLDDFDKQLDSLPECNVGLCEVQV